MTGACDGQLEGVNMKALFVGVAQKSDKVVLLKTLGIVLLVDE